MDALQGHRAKPGPLGNLCTMQRKNYIDDAKTKEKQRTLRVLLMFRIIEK